MPRRSKGNRTQNIFQLWPSMPCGGNTAPSIAGKCVKYRSAKPRRWARKAGNCCSCARPMAADTSDILYLPLACTTSRVSSAGARCRESAASRCVSRCPGPANHGAALDGGHVFVGVKREGGDVAEAADGLAPPQRALHQRRILDHAQAVAARQRIQGVHIAQAAGKMGGHDGLGARRDGGLGLRQIDGAGDQRRNRRTRAARPP